MSENKETRPNRVLSNRKDFAPASFLPDCACRWNCPDGITVRNQSLSVHYQKPCSKRCVSPTPQPSTSDEVKDAEDFVSDLKYHHTSITSKDPHCNDKSVSKTITDLIAEITRMKLQRETLETGSADDR